MEGTEIEKPVVQVEKPCKGEFLFKAANLLAENDKHAVIIAVLAIVIYSLYMLGLDAKEIASNAISGLFGIAVGRTVK
jgi:hypothetical protein